MNQDGRFVQLAKEGHSAGLEALYRQYFSAIYRFCYWQTNRSTDAEDLTQDIFIEMAKSIRHFRGDSSFKNWLYIIAKRRISQWIKQKYDLPTTELLDIIGDTEKWVDENNLKLKEKIVRNLLNLLSPIEKKVLRLRYLRNYTVKETAAELRVSEANVKVICHRSLKKMRQGGKSSE